MRAATRERLHEIVAVVEEYSQQGFKLTLRQLYYQLVVAGIMPNEQRQYAKLSKILTDARMCGMIDWDIIEDRIRVPRRPPQWDSVADILDTCANQFRRDRHEDQDNYVEVWVEKDALSGVLLPITAEYHVHLMVNRGYSSVSAMHDAATRFQSAEHAGKDSHIIYLGDHDPSGLDMVRDIRSRLERFQTYVDVHPIALTMEQIELYNPPPNPAKVTDPRASEYIAQHGNTSWELDALRPTVLHELLRRHLNALIDIDRYHAQISKEDEQILLIRGYADDSKEGSLLA